MSGINKYVDEGGVPLIGYDGDSMIDIESEADGDTYLRTVARLTELKYFDQIHEYEVRRHCLLRIIPPFWYYWRFLFIRFNWFVVFILYLSFVIILPAVGAGFGVKTYRTPSIFRLEGFGCLNVPNLTFEYYFQPLVGVCNVSAPQTLHSGNCLLWSDTTFWQEFNDPEDAHDYKKYGAWVRFIFYYSVFLSGVGRIIEAMIALIYNSFRRPTTNSSKRGCSLSDYSINVTFAITNLINWAALATSWFCYAMMANFGGHSDLIYQPSAWQQFYFCQDVDRTPLSPLVFLTVATMCGCVHLLITMAPTFGYVRAAILGPCCPACR
jgi:hypothetical protein